MPVTTTIYDTEDQFNWAEKRQTFDDENGVLVQSAVTYDSGVIKINSISDGVVLNSIVADAEIDGGLYNWSERVSSYDFSGVLESISTTYDSGVVQMDRYENGVRTSSLRRDGEDNAESWSDFDLYYNAYGELTSKVVQYDDLTAQVSQYSEGHITSHEQYDIGNNHGWDRIETAYDTYGQTAEKITFYDNNVVRVDTYEEGRRTKIEQYDTGEGAGVKSWDRIETTFDQYGQVAEKVTFYDNGIVRVEGFTDGVRASVAQYDAADQDGSGVKNWDRIEATYDVNGQIAEKATVYDNGVIKVQTYERGALREVVQYDEADAKPWESIEVNYHADGEVRTYTTFDNGVDRFELRLAPDGPISGRQVYDEDLSEDGSARNWQTNSRSYDENNVLNGQRVLYDTGDEFLTWLTDGELDRKMERDGDDSHSWVLRVTDYTDEGPVVTTYDTVADVPEDFLPYFDAF